MPFKTTVNWLFDDVIIIYDVIKSLVVLIEKLVFFNKQLEEVYFILNC